MAATVVALKPAKGKAALDIIRVTPQMAMQLLEQNGLNRPLSQTHVLRIASQIKGGKWKFNGDTIKIADTNDVLDGQHRLWGIVEAGIPVDTVIVRGIAKEAFSTIDTIRRLRSGGDVLALAGQRRYGTIAASALGWMLRWQRDALVDYRAPENKIENSDIEAAFESHPKIVHAVERAIKLRGLCNPSVMAFLYYIVSNRDPELATRMMDTLENPNQASVNDPFFRLRSYFTTDHHKRKEPVMTIALTFKAVNAANKKRYIEKLSWRNSGPRAEEFPDLDV